MSEREVEVPWAIERASGLILDVGCAESDYLEALDGAVDGIDVRDGQPPGLVTFHKADIRHPPAMLYGRYDTVLAISTIEHIGLAHEPYETVEDDADVGDLHALQGCLYCVKPGGKLLVTVPFGPTFENRGWYRIYDAADLGDLFTSATFRPVTTDVRWNPGHWGVPGVALVEVQC